jgi:hypothetical protein
MKRKLNGWQRIGILASIIWIIGAFFHTFDRAEARDIQMAIAIDEACIVARPAEQQKCDDDEHAQVMRDLPGERAESAIVALVPVPLAWGFCYLAVFLVRWIKRGFGQ